MREIGVGLLGLGSVGSGVIKLLRENQERIESRLGARFVIRGICVRDPSKARDVDIGSIPMTSDAAGLVAKDNIDIVCELIGGTTDAKQIVLSALTARKHVVTANKALLAEHADEVFGCAAKHQADIYYEAAVGGGIPIIRALREGLASDRIESIQGIVNGTSNFILTQMAGMDMTFEETLKEAQRAGYAEADPTLDISGGDAAHKLSILSTLAFGAHVVPSDIHTEGIDNVTPTDFAFAERFGFTIKPLAIAREHIIDGKRLIEARVHPTLVPTHWLLASVPDAKNALYVRSYALGPSLFYGAGAGSLPTAMAVVSDLMEVGRNMLSEATGRLPSRSYQQIDEAHVRPMDDIITRYYVRFTVRDRAGVLGKLTKILGDYEVSIAQLIQEERTAQETAGEFASVIVLTHKAREKNFAKAMAKIATIDDCLSTPVVLRVAQ